MLDRIINNIIKDTAIQVVGVHFGNVTSYHVLKLSNKKGQLAVDERLSNLSFEKLQEHLNKNQSILLVFLGKGILNKNIKRVPDYRSKVLLNVNQNDFFFYEVLQEKDVFVSVARKTTIEEQLSLFSVAHFLVVDYSIGPFSSVILKPFINQDEFVSDKITLQFSVNELVGYLPDSSQKNITIESQELSNIEVPLFATALNYYIPNTTLAYDSEFLSDNKQEKKYKKYFEGLGVATLICFFLSLCISYLLLGNFNDKTITVNNSLSMLQDSYSKVRELEKERDDKRSILNESGIFTDHFLSFYVAELGTDLPKTIRFSDFLLFPPLKKIKQSDKVLFKTNIITIRGVSTSNTKFNNWYKGLKKIKWISTLDITKYNANKKSYHNFEIQIQLK